MMSEKFEGITFEMVEAVRVGELLGFDASKWFVTEKFCGAVWGTNFKGGYRWLRVTVEAGYNRRIFLVRKKTDEA